MNGGGLDQHRQHGSWSYAQFFASGVGNQSCEGKTGFQGDLDQGSIRDYGLDAGVQAIAGAGRGSPTFLQDDIRRTNACLDLASDTYRGDSNKLLVTNGYCSLL